MDNWPFDPTPNVAAITTRQVIEDVFTLAPHASQQHTAFPALPPTLSTSRWHAFVAQIDQPSHRPLVCSDHFPGSCPCGFD